MPDTSDKKMDEKNVVYPDSRHAKLGVYSGIKGQLKLMLAPKVEGDLDKLNFSLADKLIKDAMAKKEVKDIYFKIGVIGTDLVLRVKSQQQGIKQILGYDQKDALLLKGCKLKASGGGKKSEQIDFPTFMVLTPGDCKAIVTQYYDMGTGYGIKLSVKVEGADENSGVRARVADLHKSFCADYKKQAPAIADELAAALSKLTVKSEKTLGETATDAQKKIEALLRESEVTKAFETRVEKMIAGDQNLKQHAREWKIKGACTAIITTLKLAGGIVRAVASHGADITAYKTIVSCGLGFYTLIKDFMKKESEVAAELDKSIALYARVSADLVSEIQAVFKANNLAATTRLGKMEALVTSAGDAAKLAQNKVTKAIKDFTGKDPGQAPESARKRYLVELGKLIGALDTKFNELAAAADKFAQSTIKDAVRAWPAIQSLKKSCQDALQAFKDRQTYAEAAREKIAAMSIEVDDSTDLDKLTKMVAGLRRMDKSMVIAGASPLATIAGTVQSAYSAVNGLVTAVVKFA